MYSENKMTNILSEKAKELHKLSNERKYSDNLHDYFFCPY